MPKTAAIKLQKAISDAANLLSSTVEGSGERKFLIGSKSILNKAVNSAQKILDLSDSSEELLNKTVWNLYHACTTYETKCNVNNFSNVDKSATKETKYLYKNLKELSGKTVLFGMHDITGYGVGWNNDFDRSDVKDVCGDYPALHSFDFNRIERNYKIEELKYSIESAYKRGSIITLVWHQYDPDLRSFYSKEINNEKIVDEIIPGGSRHS